MTRLSPILEGSSSSNPWWQWLSLKPVSHPSLTSQKATFWGQFKQLSAQQSALVHKKKKNLQNSSLLTVLVLMQILSGPLGSTQMVGNNSKGSWVPQRGPSNICMRLFNKQEINPYCLVPLETGFYLLQRFVCWNIFFKPYTNQKSQSSFTKV